MNPRRLRIGKHDTAWHDPFYRFVSEIFRGSDAKSWALWEEFGGWDDGYEVFAIAVDDRLVATIGRTRMRYVVDGAERVGYQLGAVATRDGFRRRGLARQLMGWVVDKLDRPDQPIILFANETVLDFYPRFGFRRVMQSRFLARAELRATGRLARPCELAHVAERARLAELCWRARPMSQRFAARDYYFILLWHLTNRPVRAFWLDGLDAVIAATMAGDRLILHDLIAAAPFDLRQALPLLCAEPATEIEFCFSPEAWWPMTEVSLSEEGQHPLFVRGVLALPPGALRFPDLAQT